MKQDLKQIIIEDYNAHKDDNLQFQILGLLDVVDGYVDITMMFNNYLQVKELGIKYKAIAKNEDGYDILLDLGFPKNKIIKEYA